MCRIKLMLQLQLMLKHVFDAEVETLKEYKD